MRIFVDNCLSPVLASTLNGYVAHLGHDAVHIKDMPCGRSAADVDWMALLRATGEEWLVITGDLRIQKNRPERYAFKQANLRGIALTPGYQGFRVHQQISMLLWRWLDIDELVLRVGPPYLFEVPTTKNAKFRSLSL
ncbi:MAG: hypothetical protein ACRYGP_02765 [Janthinobacterium lividum]